MNRSGNGDNDESTTHGMTLLAAAPVSDRARRAHDIKNIVSCISAIALLLDRDAASAQPLFRERVARLQSISDRLCDLVRQELATPEPPPRVAFCAMDAARDVVRQVHDRALDAGVQVELVAETANLRGDRRALEDVLFNLVLNAIDATPRGGRITVSVKTNCAGDHEWTVRDTGCGIPEERLSELGRVLRSSKPGGSGFGLAIAQSVIADHGGVLRVESCEGRGTTFTVFLPAG